MFDVHELRNKTMSKFSKFLVSLLLVASYLAFPPSSYTFYSFTTQKHLQACSSFRVGPEHYTLSFGIILVYICIKAFWLADK